MEQAIEAYVFTKVGVQDNSNAMRDIFKQMDADGNGQLSKEELDNGIKKIMGVDAFCKDDLDRIFDKMDPNKDGEISYEEFLAEADGFCMLLSDARMHTAFLLIDQDEDGKVTLQEVEMVLSGGIKKIGQKEWQTLLDKFDKNSDGMIDFEEFKIMMIHAYAM